MPGGVEQKNQGRARVKIAVFFVLAVHVVVLGALLMQGCKKEEAPPVDPNIPVADTNLTPALDTTPPALPLPGAITPLTNQPPQLAVPAPVDVPPPAGGMTEYTIVLGDSFYTIAKKFHVTMQAVQDANPGVEPTKLQPGQKINIPAAAPALPSPGGVTPAEADGSVYVVKSGDTLSAIALKYHTTVRALRSANNLTTDRITVGQKLKIPASAPAPGAPPSQ
jgi:LysM repeat protein